jgi:hypothetical protein
MNTISDQINVIRAWASTASENKAMNKQDLKFVLQNVAVELLKVQQSILTSMQPEKGMRKLDKFAISATIQKAQQSYSNGDKAKALDPDAELDAVTDAIWHLLSQPSQQSGGVVPYFKIVGGKIQQCHFDGRSMGVTVFDGKNPDGTDVILTPVIHAHLAAQQPPRVDLSGVKKDLKEALSYQRNIDHFERCIRSALKRVEDLEKLLTLPQTEKGEGWVSERLPEESGEYLVWDSASGVRYAEFCGPEDGEPAFFDTYNPNDVTHWQPLPSPPQDAGKKA